MAQRRVWDFKSPDETRIMNDMNRRVVRPGVYHGFEVADGGVVAGKMYLRINRELHDDLPSKADPGGNDALSVAISKDYVTIIENADVEPATRPDTPYSAVYNENGLGRARIDIVALSYEYELTNQPNPVATYSVHVGTPAVDPEPDFGLVADDEIILAFVWVPDGTNDSTGGYGSPGVVIDNVPKINLPDPYNRPGDELHGLFRPGVYQGFDLVASGNPDEVEINPGVMVTPYQEDRYYSGEYHQTIIRMDEATSPFAVDAPTAGSVRLDAFYLVSRPDKRRGQDQDYKIIKVEGTEQVIGGGTNPELPDASDIQSAIDSDGDLGTGQYTDANATFLGYVRVIEDGGGGAEIEKFYSTEKRSVPEEVEVTDGIIFQGRSQYIGSVGLINLLADLHTLMEAEDDPIPRRVQVEGLFWLDGDLYLPSRISLTGGRTFSKIVFNGSDKFYAGGIEIAYNGGDNPYAGVPGTPGGAPAGSTRYRIEIAAAYRAGRPTPVDLGFVPGDTVVLSDGANHKLCAFVGFPDPGGNPWEFDVDVPTAGLPAGTTQTNSIHLIKQHSSIEQMSVEGGTVYIDSTEDCEYRDAHFEGAVFGYNWRCLISRLSLGATGLSDAAGAVVFPRKGWGNAVDMLFANGGDIVLGVSNDRLSVSLIDAEGQDVTLGGSDCLVSVVNGDLYFAATANGNYVTKVIGDVENVANAVDNFVAILTGTPTYNTGGSTEGNIFGGMARTLRGTSSFVGHGGGSQTITLPNDLGTTDYGVYIFPIDDGATPPGEAGQLGEVWVTERSATDFKVYNSGDSTADFEWVLVIR